MTAKKTAATNNAVTTPATPDLFPGYQASFDELNRALSLLLSDITKKFESVEQERQRLLAENARLQDELALLRQLNLAWQAKK